MYKKIKKHYSLILIIGATLSFIFLSLVFFSSRRLQGTSTLQTQPSALPTQPAVTPLDKYPVDYNTKASQSFWEKVDKLPPLSSADVKAKNNLLLATLKTTDSGGVVYESANVSVDYVHALDIFQAKILTRNLSQAKNETVAWLRGYGLSNQGICNLPIMFSIDIFVAQSLKGEDITFNPLPDGCQ